MSLNNSVDWSTGEYAAVDEADEINVLSAEEYCAMAKRVGLEIDPATAEIHFSYVQVTDPYGVFPPPPDEFNCVGGQWFAGAPDGDVWVCFHHLPEATRLELQRQIDAGRRPTDVSF